MTECKNDASDSVANRPVGGEASSQATTEASEAPGLWGDALRLGGAACRDVGLGVLELCFPATCVLCCGPLEERGRFEGCGPIEGQSRGAAAWLRDRSLCGECSGVLRGSVIESGCWGCGRRLAELASWRVEDEVYEADLPPGVLFNVEPEFERSGESTAEVDASGGDLRLGEASGRGDGKRPLCFHCRREPSSVSRTIALGGYQDVLREAVLASKRLSFAPLAMALGRMLGRKISEQLSGPPLDVVTFIPSHWTRRCSRRGVPTQVIAGEVGRELGVRVRPLLRSCRRTQKQGMLTDSERGPNVRDAFRVKSRYALAHRRVLIVDDVWTTGSTLREAARVLRLAGSEDVMAGVVARAVGQHQISS